MTMPRKSLVHDASVISPMHWFQAPIRAHISCERAQAHKASLDCTLHPPWVDGTLAAARPVGAGVWAVGAGAWAVGDGAWAVGAGVRRRHLNMPRQAGVSTTACFLIHPTSALPITASLHFTSMSGPHVRASSVSFGMHGPFTLRPQLDTVRCLPQWLDPFRIHSKRKFRRGHCSSRSGFTTKDWTLPTSDLDGSEEDTDERRASIAKAARVARVEGIAAERDPRWLGCRTPHKV